MSERFIIDCYGIIDTWKNNTGKCSEDKLSWAELCDTLNELDNMANDKFNNYEYVVKLTEENELLKEKLLNIESTLTSIRQDLFEIDLIIRQKK